MVHIRSALRTAAYQVFYRLVLRKDAKKRNSYLMEGHQQSVSQQLVFKRDWG